MFSLLPSFSTNAPSLVIFSTLPWCICPSTFIEIFFNQLSNKFCLLYDRYVCEGFKFIKDYYESKSGFLTKEISINVLGETHTGIAERITDDGALVLNENNTENIYYIGDIL